MPDQIFPPDTNAYALLRSGDCGALLRRVTAGEGEHSAWAVYESPGVPPGLIQLYTAAALACLKHPDAKGAADSADPTCDLDDTGLDLDITANSYRVGEPRSPADVTRRKGECEAQRAEVLRWTRDVIAALETDPGYVPDPSGAGG